MSVTKSGRFFQEQERTDKKSGTIPPMRLRFLSLLLSCAVLLSGCPAGVFIGGAAAGGAINDERTLGAQAEDQEIESKAFARLSEHIGGRANVSVVSYNRRVLVVGQVPTEDLRKQALQIVGDIENVLEVHDRLEIVGAASLAARLADSALTAKVKAILCGVRIEGFSCLDVKVVTEQSTVYLLGLLTKKQAADAVATVRDIKGVKRVVKVFEYRD